MLFLLPSLFSTTKSNARISASIISSKKPSLSSLL